MLKTCVQKKKLVWKKSGLNFGGGFTNSFGLHVCIYSGGKIRNLVKFHRCLAVGSVLVVY